MTHEPAGAVRGRAVDISWCGAVVLLAAVAMGPAVHNSFVAFDDYDYLLNNRHIQSGFTAETVAWAFTQAYAYNWHPVTWLSHMIDWSWFHAQPAGHHLVSVLIHALNGALLFALLRALTGGTVGAGVAAILFAVHPVHVESVAWASERKDVLGGLFWLLTLLAYVRYVRRPSGGAASYALVLVTLAVGLMAKQMLVTIPAILLILDVWPLRRIGPAGAAGWRRCVVEKIPLAIVAVAAAWIVVRVQTVTGTVKSLDEIPLALRLANAPVATVQYAVTLLWPAGLSVFYPYPHDGFPPGQVLGAMLALALVSAAAIGMWRWFPCVLAGWLWYLVALLPVIGLVQVGVQARADRYVYLPAVGLYLAVGCLVERSWLRSRRARLAWGVAIAVLAVVLVVLCRRQVAVWRNSEALFSHAARVVADNYWAHYNLGVELERQGRGAEAEREYQESIRAKPDFPEGHYNLGVLLAGSGRLAEAVREYEAAVSLKPLFAPARCNLAALLAGRGQDDAAVRHYRAALSADPCLAEAHAGLAILLERKGDIDESGRHYREALRLRPGWPLGIEGIERLEGQSRKIGSQPGGGP